jgi:hypothetical protein
MRGIEEEAAWLQNADAKRRYTFAKCTEEQFQRERLGISSVLQRRHSLLLAPAQGYSEESESSDLSAKRAASAQVRVGKGTKATMP